MTAGGSDNERNIMKQIIIRMFVALTICGVTSLIRLTSFVVISPTLQLRNEAIWIFEADFFDSRVDSVIQSAIRVEFRQP